MKKHFLSVAMLIAALTSLFAQKVEQLPASQAAAAALMEANNPKVARISPHENVPIYSTNSVNSFLIGESSNSEGFVSHTQRQLSTVNIVGTNGGSVAFIFRQNWTNCGSAAVETGVLRYNLSTNGGQSWMPANGMCLGQGPLNPYFTYPAYSPNALLFSDGGTTINNLNLAYTSSVISGTNWRGAVYGTANNLGNSIGLLINQEDYVSTGVAGVYRPENIVERVSGEFWSAVVTAANALEIRKGSWNASASIIDWNIVQTMNLNSSLNNASGSTFLSNPIITFSENGTKGYIVMSGDLIGGWDNCQNPIICEYNATTAQFNAPYELSFNSFPTIPLTISQYLSPSGTIIADRGSMINHSVTVDSRGELHIFALIAPANGAASFYPNFETNLCDMTKDASGNWSAIYIDSIANANSTIGNAAALLNYATFASISRSADGKYLIYSWNDTDTTGMGANVVANPNLKGRIYDVLQDKISPITNWTSNDVTWNGIAHMPKTAEIVLEPTTCSFRVPTVVINDVMPTQAKYYYFTNIEYTCAQATDSVQWLTNCNTIPISINPTLTSPSCSPTATNGSINLNMTGGFAPYTYLVHDFIYHTTDTLTSPIINNLAAGIYQVSIIDAGGCGIQTQIINLNQGSAPAISIQGNNPTCAGAFTCLNVSPVTTGCNYMWNNGANGTTTCYIVNACSVIVTVQENCSGCLGYAMLAISEPDSITINTQVTNETCNGSFDGAIATSIVGGTAPYTYQWTGGSTATTANLSGLTSGTYTLNVTDANGCTGYLKTDITVLTSILVNLQVTNVSCAGGVNGSILATGFNGSPPFSYQWSGGSSASTSYISNLIVGNYHLLVQDANGCMTDTTASITAPLPLSANINVVANYLSTAVAGGTAPYTYSWSGPPCFTPPTLSSPSVFAPCSCPGMYDCSVKDANGCIINVNINHCWTIIDKEVEESAFSLVPNPAFEVATVSLAFEKSENVSISIVNVHGQSVFEKKMGNVLNLTEEIKVKDWAKGVYYVKISTDNGIISRKLVID
jgi:hypothetical protein